jgi:hypothetical protein
MGAIKLKSSFSVSTASSLRDCTTCTLKNNLDFMFLEDTLENSD